MRRTFIIIAAVIVLAGAGAAAYFYFFANKPSVVVTTPGTTTLPNVGNTTPGTTPVQTSTTTNVSSGTPGRLVQVSAGPVVLGEAVVDVPAANASSSPDVAVKYLERQSGNAYSYSVGTGTLTRTSNKTVPGIEKAWWLPNGLTAFAQYLSGTDFSTVNTYALAADGSSGFFMPQDLDDIAVSSTSVLTLASGVNGSVASVAHVDGTHAAQAFTTPLSSLRIAFLGKSQYFAFTKPSTALPGFAFSVDATGHFSRIAGPLAGLAALSSPSGKWALVTYSGTGGVMQTELVNTATNEALPLPVATIADKCVWAANDSAVYCGVPVSPSSSYSYPDDWYQGAASFSDRIWKIDVTGRYAQLVLDFSNEKTGDVDAEALAIDPAGTTLVFVNKNDGSLWSYRL